MKSKNILLSLTREEAETLAEYIFNLAEEHDDSKEDQAFDRLVEVHFKVTKALNEDKDWSAIEWHSMGEKPKDRTAILVGYKSGNVYEDIAIIDDEGYFCLDTGSLIGAVKWAYLPE